MYWRLVNLQLLQLKYIHNDVSYFYVRYINEWNDYMTHSWTLHTLSTGVQRFVHIILNPINVIRKWFWETPSYGIKCSIAIPITVKKPVHTFLEIKIKPHTEHKVQRFVNIMLKPINVIRKWFWETPSYAIKFKSVFHSARDPRKHNNVYTLTQCHWVTLPLVVSEHLPSNYKAVCAGR